jgi:hypothetical protein
MGMRRVGEAPSGSIAGRMLPHLAKDLAPVLRGRPAAARADLEGVR